MVILFADGAAVPTKMQASAVAICDSFDNPIFVALQHSLKHIEMAKIGDPKLIETFRRLGWPVLHLKDASGKFPAIVQQNGKVWSAE